MYENLSLSYALTSRESTKRIIFASSKFELYKSYQSQIPDDVPIGRLDTGDVPARTLASRRWVMRPHIDWRKKRVLARTQDPASIRQKNKCL